VAWSSIDCSDTNLVVFRLLHDVTLVSKSNRVLCLAMCHNISQYLRGGLPSAWTNDLSSYIVYRMIHVQGDVDDQAK